MQERVAPAAAERAPAVFVLALAATLTTAIVALISSRWASKGGVYSPSTAITCGRLRGDNRAGQDGRGVSLGEFSLPKDKRGLFMWFQTER